MHWIGAFIARSSEFDNNQAILMAYTLLRGNIACLEQLLLSSLLLTPNDHFQNLA